jgi:hypothetical protein
VHGYLAPTRVRTVPSYHAFGRDLGGARLQQSVSRATSRAPHRDLAYRRSTKHWMKTHSNAKAAGRRARDLRLLWWPPRGVEPPTFGSSVAPTKWPRKHSLDGGRPGDTCGDTCPSKNHYRPRRCTDGCLGQSARRSRSNGGASHSVGLRFEPHGPPNTTMVAMPSLTGSQPPGAASVPQRSTATPTPRSTIQPGCMPPFRAQRPTWLRLREVRDEEVSTTNVKAVASRTKAQLTGTVTRATSPLTRRRHDRPPAERSCDLDHIRVSGQRRRYAVTVRAESWSRIGHER